MNEIRDIIVGIDFGREYSQICYYDRKGDEARSLSMKVGGSQDEAPSCLCWRPEQKDYCVGLEAEYFVREKGGIMIDNVYGLCEKRDCALGNPCAVFAGNAEISWSDRVDQKYQVCSCDTSETDSDSG